MSNAIVEYRCSGGVPEDLSLDSFREMFSSSGSWFEGEDGDPLSLVLVVKTKSDETGDAFTEADMMDAALSAMLAVFALHGHDLDASGRLEAWTRARIRKIVKRAHSKKWRRLLSSLPMAGIPSALARIGDDGAQAVCFAPMRVSEQPPALRNLQVSGLDSGSPASCPRESPGKLAIIVDEAIGMSSGKAIAQAGHVLQLAFRCLGDDDFRIWRENGFAFEAGRGPVPGIVDVEVRDAGFTEVEPGTRTAAGVFGRNR